MRGSTRISKGLFALAVTVAFGIATGASAETEIAGQTLVAKGAAKKTGKKKHGKGGKKAKAAAVEAQESDVVVGAAQTKVQSAVAATPAAAAVNLASVEVVREPNADKLDKITATPAPTGQTTTASSKPISDEAAKRWSLVLSNYFSSPSAQVAATTAKSNIDHLLTVVGSYKVTDKLSYSLQAPFSYTATSGNGYETGDTKVVATNTIKDVLPIDTFQIPIGVSFPTSKKSADAGTVAKPEVSAILVKNFTPNFGLQYIAKASANLKRANKSVLGLAHALTPGYQFNDYFGVSQDLTFRTAVNGDSQIFGTNFNVTYTPTKDILLTLSVGDEVEMGQVTQEKPFAMFANGENHSYNVNATFVF